MVTERTTGRFAADPAVHLWNAASVCNLLTSRVAVFSATALLAACSASQPALAPTRIAPDRARTTTTERVLYSFTGGTDGGDPATSLNFDSRGNLYGTTVVGGAYGCGTVFKLTPDSSGSWQELALYDFTCYGDGKNPYGGVTFDSHSRMYGTTVSGGLGGSCGSSGCGVVFQLTSKSEKVLHSFTGGNDGFGPGGPVVFDGAKTLVGTTPDGGENGAGVVYELTAHGKSWRERVIHAFTGGKDGGTGSLGALLVDSSGNLYGVTETGGKNGGGTVFELSPTSKKKWKLTTLYEFKGTPDAASPYGGLIADTAGDLYGTTYYGGSYGQGTVFELRARNHGRYRERVLYSFTGGSDGGSPTSTLLLSGTTLYGTASAGGGSCGCGAIFGVDIASGGESVLHTFAGGSDGAYPYYGLTADGSGNLYGTTAVGGSGNAGVVYELTP